MKEWSGLKRAMVGLVGALVVGLLGINGCVLFEDEMTARGRKLYEHYCMHCHGENGRQGEGYNWEHMPDPRPRDLSESSTMSTFSDEEIFNTISRDMRDTTDPAVIDDEDYFAVATMPTFKYTLSEKELWSIVGYVRRLHGGSLTYDVEGRRKQLEAELAAAQQEHDQAKQAMEAALAKLEEEEAARAEEADEENFDDDEEYEEVVLPEEETYERAVAKLEAAKQALENFTKRPKRTQISPPDFSSFSEEERATLARQGKHLYFNKYGCHACHSIGGEGGVVGPVLDRAGFRLNKTWIYRWILYPQGIKKHTRMPNLGISESDAIALTMFLDTLRAPRPDHPIPPPE
ncbi:MAG: cytochrome c [Nitrospirae bacterium]|nr:MAG: cytochrome c [Nitrospirota bacterium]